MALLTGSGERSLFAGIPDKTLEGLELRRAENVGSIPISKDEAIAAAASKGISAPQGAAPVSLEEQLLWMRDDNSPTGERLVWGINFADPESVSIEPPVPGCIVDRKALHVVVFVDALTADFVVAAGGYASVDLSSICPNAPFPGEPGDPAEPGETLAP